MIVLKLFLRDEYKARWLCRVKCILDNCGLSYMWYNQHLIDAKQCKIITCKRIEDIALQKWYTDISISPMCTLYRLFKKHLNFEKYIICVASLQNSPLVGNFWFAFYCSIL